MDRIAAAVAAAASSVGGDVLKIFFWKLVQKIGFLTCQISMF